jgi:dihydroorotase
VEFEVAEYGMVGLQTALPGSAKPGLPAELLVEKLAINPREILGLSVPVIAEGEQANITLFDADTEWEYTRKNNLSKSVNFAFYWAEP